MKLRIADGYFDSKIRVLHIIGCGSFEDFREDYNQATWAVIKSANPNYTLAPGERIEDSTACILLESDWDDYEQMLENCKRNHGRLYSFIEYETRPNVIICWGWKRSTNTSSVVRCLCEGIYGEPVRQLYEVRSREGDTYGNVFGYGVLNWWGPWQSGYNPKTVKEDLAGYFSREEKKYSSRFSRSVNRSSSLKSVVLCLAVQFCVWFLPILLKKPEYVRFTIVCYYALAFILPYIRNKSPKRFFRTLKGTVGKVISLIGGFVFVFNSIRLLYHPEQITGVEVFALIMIPLVYSLFSIFNCKQQSKILYSTAFFDALTIYFQFFVNIIRPAKEGDKDLSFFQQLKCRFYSVEHHKKIDSRFNWKSIPNSQKQNEEEDANSNEEGRVDEPEEDKRSYYLQILEVDEFTSDEAITKSYHELIKKYHPDLYASETKEIQKEMEDKTKLVNEAYEYLVENKNR